MRRGLDQHDVQRRKGLRRDLSGRSRDDALVLIAEILRDRDGERSQSGVSQLAAERHRRVRTGGEDKNGFAAADGAAHVEIDAVG